MSEKTVFSRGSFYHGTKADLEIGDFILTGKKKNYNDDRKSEYVYFAGTLDAAIWGAEQPLKIVAEVTRWEGHSPEMRNAMTENLKKLSEKGIKAID